MSNLTQTTTKVISGTSLLVATFAAFGAGAIALATVPISSVANIGGSSTVNVDYCKQLPNGISVIKSDVNYGKPYTLTNGCVGDKTYNYTCTAEYSGASWKWYGYGYSYNENVSYSYKVVSKACTNGPAVACKDSDGGANLLVKGTATGIQYISNQPITATDSCNIKGQIQEQFCNSSGYQFYVVKNCPTGTVCNDGACVNNAVTSTCYMLENGGKKVKVTGEPNVWYISNPTTNPVKHKFATGEIFLSWFVNYMGIEQVTSEQLNAYVVGDDVCLNPASLSTTLTVTKNISSPSVAPINSNATLAVFKLSASGNNVKINKINFNVTPELHKVKNLQLKAGSNVLSTHYSEVAGVISFDNFSLNITKGGYSLFTIIGDTTEYQNTTSTNSVMFGVNSVEAVNSATNGIVDFVGLPVNANNVVIK